MITIARPFAAAALLLAACLAAAPAQAQQPSRRGTPPRTADYIVAIVNQELVTAQEIESRVVRARDEARRAGQTLPPEPELRRQVLDALIEERVLITHARDSGLKVDEAELDRAVANVAAQNQLTLPQLRERLRREGIDETRFRSQIRDRLLVERLREREVQSRIRISDAEIDTLLEQRRSSVPVEYNIAQLLVAVPEDAAPAVVAERQAVAEKALARALGGEPFEALVRELSSASKERGGEIGLRPANRLPDLFVERVRDLASGSVAPALVRSGAGFHVLKLVERRDGGSAIVTQTRARHILLRPSEQLGQSAAMARLADFKRQIESGRRGFEALAREHSEDGSAPQGGDLGWASPGQFVPEFEQAMNALPVNGLSEPVASRFGVHLIQVVDRRSATLDARQLREQARNVLREQKFEKAYDEWVRELRARAYIEMREPPL
jgi:peptidyl-prolyl cis-trans isomerase SurA